MVAMSKKMLNDIKIGLYNLANFFNAADSALFFEKVAKCVPGLAHARARVGVDCNQINSRSIS